MAGMRTPKAERAMTSHRQHEQGKEVRQHGQQGEPRAGDEKRCDSQDSGNRSETKHQFVWDRGFLREGEYKSEKVEDKRRSPEEGRGGNISGDVQRNAEQQARGDEGKRQPMQP